MLTVIRLVLDVDLPKAVTEIHPILTGTAGEGQHATADMIVFLHDAITCSEFVELLTDDGIEGLRRILSVIVETNAHIKAAQFAAEVKR